MPRIGQCYPWFNLPGQGYGYLRFNNGRAVCAALQPALNPDAPKVILVGEGPLREKWAQILCDQDRNIPIDVYLKRGTNKWEYAGEFVVQASTEAVDDIRRHEKKAKRHDVVRVIYLKNRGT